MRLINWRISHSTWMVFRILHQMEQLTDYRYPSVPCHLYSLISLLIGAYIKTKCSLITLKRLNVGNREIFTAKRNRLHSMFTVSRSDSKTRPQKLFIKRSIICSNAWYPLQSQYGFMIR